MTRAHFSKSFTQQLPIPDDAIEAAIAVMRSGRLRRYNTATGAESETKELERGFAGGQGQPFCLAMPASGIIPDDMMRADGFTLAPVVQGARSGVKSSALEQTHAGYSLVSPRWRMMRYVVMPSAMPEILTVMRIAIGFGWTTLVAAEMVASTKGLGYMVLSASQFLQTPVVIMGIFAIAIIAFAFDLLMRFVERRAVPWKGRM
jgi:ABC-type proline/glycine betaine transport system permease subunit